MDYDKETLLKLKKNNPEKFAKVLEEDCPCGWGFGLKDVNYCLAHDCEDCWAEALKNVDNGKSV